MLKDIILLAIGFLVGAMNAIAGGGMLMGFPVMLAVGLPALVANATANVALIPGQITSIYAYRNYIRKIPRYFAWLLVPCFVGGALGAYILSRTNSNQFERLVPGLILFAVLLFALQPFLHFHLLKRMRLSRSNQSRLTFWLVILAMWPTAIYGGYFGAGFGFIMLAFLGFTNLHDVHKMNAMKNVGGFCITVMSVIVLFHTGLIDWHHGLVMAVGSGFGGYFGARIAQKVSSHYLRIAIITVGITAAIYIALRSY